MIKNKFTIVTPVFNGEDHLVDLYDNLSSILSNLDISWVIVNDASTDNTRKIALSLIEKNNKISLVDLEYNSGPANARSQGVKSAKSKYIFFLDADDYILENSFYDFLEFINYSDGYDYYYSPLLVTSKKIKENSINNEFSGIVEINSPVGFIINSFPQPSSLVVVKDFFDKYNVNNNLKWGEDFLMYLILGKYGKGVRWGRNVSCYIINGQGRGSKLSLKLRIALSKILYIESFKKGKIFSSIVYSSFLTLRHIVSYLYKKLIKSRF